MSETAPIQPPVPLRDRLRAMLEASDLATAQTRMRYIIRRAARNRVYSYARRQKIVDFDDTVLVSNRHRTFRENVVSQATTKVGESDAASSVAEVLAVFDSISEYI